MASPRILLADDQDLTHLVVGMILEEAGYTVEHVHDGQAALAACLTDDPPALAILDVHMPHLTGLEVGERIRGRVPFIIFSTEEHQAKAQAIGAVEFVRKFPLPDEMVAIVERCLTGHSSASGDDP